MEQSRCNGWRMIQQLSFQPYGYRRMHVIDLLPGVYCFTLVFVRSVHLSIRRRPRH